MKRFKLFFPTSSDNIEDIVMCKKSADAFVKKILMTLHRIDCERDTEVFIDLSNKKKFIVDYKALEDLLKFRIGSYELEEVINGLIYANSIKTSSEDIEVNYTFSLLNSFSEIDSFFGKVNESRILNKQDFRHCENHAKYIIGKSPLIGGIGGFDKAEIYLPPAIGDAKTKRNVLINIDSENSDFIIRYEDENFNNQFHAYHIVVNVKGKYIIDCEKLELLKSSRKGIPRAFKLIEYRNSIVEN